MSDAFEEEGTQEVFVTTTALEAVTRAEVDIQISTAQRFPRDLARAIKGVTAMVTSTKDIAAACHYCVPRAGKKITGATIRFAEILVSQWRNFRVAARITDIGEAYVTAEAVFLDLEANGSTLGESKRRITNQSGERYNDDMIGVTCNAACAIARRNAILAGIPRPLWEPAYLAALDVLAGKPTELQADYRKAVGFFAKKGIPESKILATLGLKAATEIDGDSIVTLRGIATAIKEGTVTAEAAFSEPIQDEVMANGTPEAIKIPIAAEAPQRVGGHRDDHRLDPAPAEKPGELQLETPAVEAPAPAQADDRAQRSKLWGKWLMLEAHLTDGQRAEVVKFAGVKKPSAQMDLQKISTLCFEAENALRLAEKGGAA